MLVGTQALADELGARLRAVIDALPDTQRAVLELRDVQGFGSAEVCKLLSISEANRIVGKAEKSNGRSMKSVTVSIKIAKANESASPRSSTQAGIGKTIIMITAIRASASKMVGW